MVQPKTDTYRSLAENNPKQPQPTGNRKVDKLNFMAFDREKQLKPEFREALCQERAEICKLPDEEAERLLRDILNREGECEA